MDFEHTPDGAEAAGLAAAILENHCTPERLARSRPRPARFDHDLWRRFADSGPGLADRARGARRQRARPARAVQRAGRGRPHGRPAAARHARRHRDGAGPVRQPRPAGPVAAGAAGSASSILTTALAEDRQHVPARADHPRRERRRQLAADRQQGRRPRRPAGRPVRRTRRHRAGADRLPRARRRPGRDRRTPAGERRRGRRAARARPRRGADGPRPRRHRRRRARSSSG